MAEGAKKNDGIPIWRNVSKAGKVYFKIKLPDGQAFVIYKNDHWTEQNRQPFMRAFVDKPADDPGAYKGAQASAPTDDSDMHF